MSVRTPPSGLASLACGLAGHFHDLLLIFQMDFVNPRSYTKFRVLDSVRRRTGAKVFIEAGTHQGVTAARAARCFDAVYTIELEAVLARKAREYLAGISNVRIVEGDSLQVL